MKNPRICHICLRTDRELIQVHYLLSQFHDQLIRESVKSCLTTDSLSYCMECAHLLRKAYNFRARCKTAAGVLENWRKTNISNRKSMHFLYNELPQSTLGPWSPNNSRVYVCTSADLENTTPIDLKSNEIDSITKRVSTEYNHISTNGISVKREYCYSPEQVQSNVDMTNKQTKKLFITLNGDEIPQANFRITDYDDKVSTRILLNAALDHNYTKTKKQISNIEEMKLLDELANIHSNGDIKNYDETVNDVLNTEQMFDDDNCKIEPLEDYEDLDNDFDSTNDFDYDVIEKIADDKSILDDYIFRIPYLKWLKEMLKTKFESCGELILKDGTKINKKLILENFPEELNSVILKRLWIKLHKEKLICPSTVILFKSIQDVYQNFSRYKTVFDIEYLDSEEKVLEEFQKRKTYECYLNAKYKCEICFLPQTHHMAKSHGGIHDESAGNYVCKICSVRRKTSIRLASHMRNSHKVVYKCKVCPLVTYYRSSMINHYNYHKGNLFQCNICGVCYKSKSTYLTHRARHATQYACAMCGRNYVSAMALKIHIRVVHEDQPLDSGSVHCEVCNLGFSSFVALNNHRKVHKNVYPICRRDLRNANLKQRKESRNAYMYKCEECGATGRGGGWKPYHYKTEHPDVDLEQLNAHKKTYLCQFCAKRFPTITTLRVHINKHTGEKPHACTKCPQRFTSRANLRDHMYWHYPPTNECHECGKKYYTKASLYNHTLSHIGNRRYKCKICEKGFVSSALLNEHFRGVHLQMRRAKRKAIGEDGEKRRRKKRYVVEENSE